VATNKGKVKVGSLVLSMRKTSKSIEIQLIMEIVGNVSCATFGGYRKKNGSNNAQHLPGAGTTHTWLIMEI
jgi:hypothetical protein